MLTAIYDGNCVICNTTKRLVTFLDWRRRVTFFDLHQQTELLQNYPFIDPQAAMGAIHVVDQNQQVFIGFAGTRRMLRALPLAWPLYGLLRLPIIGNWLGPMLYRFIAKHRYAINRLLGVELDKNVGACDNDVCKLPE